MKNNLVLLLPSLIQVVILVWHMSRYRGKNFVVTFIGFGFIFGLARSFIINSIQVGLNNSFRPYEFNGGMVQIFGDPLQIYIGWITTAYLALCIAEIFIKKFQKTKASIFQIVAIGFIFITTFSYLVETSASVMHWWSWNQFLEAGFRNSIFVNVPWVGIIDWGTVAFEFLGVYLLGSHALKTKKYWYLLLGLIFPGLHWISHTSFMFQNITIFDYSLTIPNLIHILIPIIAFLLFFIKEPRYETGLDSEKSDYIIFMALGISYFVCLFSDLIVGKDMMLLVSVIPITLLILIIKYGTRKTNVIALISFLVIILLPLPNFEKQKIIISFYPLVAINIFRILKVYNFELRLKNFAIFCLAMLIIFVTIFSIPRVSFSDLSGNKKEVGATQKKVILVTLDTLRADHLSTYGYDRNTDPNINNFSKQSLLFENAYTTIPFTLPSHMSIMSGKSPNNLGGYQNNFSGYTETLPELFVKDGFKTAAFVGTNILYRSPMSTGFETFNFSELDDQNLRRNGDKTNLEVSKWLGDNKNNDFFLWVHYFDIHSPYNSSCKSSYFSKEIEPDNKNLKSLEARNFKNDFSKLSQNDLKYLEANYDEGINCVDKYFGDLINILKKDKIYDDSTIILLSDHGENFDHNSLFHGDNLYNSAVRIPLMIKSPFMKTGRESMNVSETDIYKTLANLYNLNYKKTRKNSVDLQEPDKNRTLYFQSNNKSNEISKNQDKTDFDVFNTYTQLGLSNKHTKFIYDLDHKKFEIYDLLKDKNEMNDLSSGFNLGKTKPLDKLDKYFKTSLSP